MTALAALQAGFADYLLQETGEAPLRPLVRVPDSVDAGRRLHVYRNAYRERLHETLRSDYPVLLRLMGGEAFATLAYACIDAHRSASPNIRWYGANLPAVAAGAAPWCDMPGLADMARFEWWLGLAFDAADIAAIDAGALADVPAEAWAGLGFLLHPSLHLLWLGHAVPDWWLAVQDRDAAGADPPAPVADDGHWAIWRSAVGVRFRRLDADEADALQAVHAGDGFGALCTLLAEHVGEADAAGRAAGLLRVWLDSGWIVGLHLPGEGALPVA
jgi:hypothetical protein